MMSATNFCNNSVICKGVRERRRKIKAKTIVNYYFKIEIVSQFISTN
jgi:hypothetical protein